MSDVEGKGRPRGPLGVYTFAKTRGFVEFWIAPYCFFTPNSAFDLGIHSVLWMIR